MNIVTGFLVRPGLDRDVTLFDIATTGSEQTPDEVLYALGAAAARSRIVRTAVVAATVWTSDDCRADHSPNPWSAMVLARALNLMPDLSPDDVIAHPALTFRGLVVVTGRCPLTGALSALRPAPDPLADAS